MGLSIFKILLKTEKSYYLDKKKYILIFIIEERLRIIKNTLKVVYLNFTFKSHLARHSVSAT